MKIFTVIAECKYYSTQFGRYMSEEEVIASFKSKKSAEEHIKEMERTDEENIWVFYILESFLVDEE